MSLALGSLTEITLILIGIFAVLQFLLVPSARRSAQKSATESRPAAAAIYAVAEFLRSAALMMALGAVLTALALMLSSAFIDHVGEDSTASVRRALGVVHWWRETIAQIHPFYSAFVVAIVIFAFAVLTSYSSKRKVSESRKRAREAELSRVMQAKAAGEWDERPPTEAMQAVANEIKGKVEFLAISEVVEEAMRTNNEALLSQFNPRPTAEQVKQAKERVGNELTLLRLRSDALDAERRMNIDPSTPELEVRPPKGWKERVMTFFASRGLLNFLSAGQRALLFATLLLLIPAHLALTSPSLDGVLATRELRLNDAAVTVSAQEATQSWEKTLAESAAPNPQQLTAEDEQAIRGAAQAFEHALVENNASMFARSFGSGAQNAARRFTSVRADEARRAVISTIEQRRGIAAEAQRAAESMPPLHREVMQFEAATSASEGRGTPLYKAAEHDLREAARRSPSFRERLKEAWASHAHSFQQLDSHSQLTSRLVSNLMAPGIDAGAQIGGEIAQLGHAFDDAAGRALRERAYKAQMASFMSSLNSNANLDTAMSSVSHPSSDHPVYSRSEVGKLQSVAAKVPDEETIVRSYEQHINRAPPGFRDVPPAPGAPGGMPPVPGAPGGSNTARAQQILKDYAAKTYAGRAIPEDFGNALASYADYFPANANEATATRMANARVAASEAAAGASGAQAARQAMTKTIASEGAKLAGMSRSYVKLSGFRRVGGVLIGREPGKSDAVIDFRDLAWSIEGNKIRLTATRVDGRMFSLGPYSANAVLPALGYAADQRPTAVTMVMAAPMRELKILAHPALEDTPIGCRAIDIDRFVDETTSKNERLGARRQQVNQDFLAVRALYSTARQEVIDVAYANASSQQKNILDQIKEASDRPDPALVERGLQTGASLFDPKRTPITAKPAYFDKQVVEFMAACAWAGTTTQNFKSCIRQRASTASLSFYNNWGWSVPTPQTDEWSGVREQAYTLDPELKFAGVGQTDRAALWPFDFIIQISFKSPAFALQTRQPWFSNENDQVMDYVDEEPWLYQDMQSDLSAAILAEIRSNREWADIFANMRDLTLLQRLFRAAFNGQLGEAFPVDKLAALAKAAAPLTRSEQTPRWNVRPGAIELDFLNVLQAVKAQLGSEPKYASLIQGINRCQSLALGSGSPVNLNRRIELSRIDQNRWNLACNFESLSADLFTPNFNIPMAGRSVFEGLQALEAPGDKYAKAAITESVRASYARELRATLGVNREDERIFSGRKSCGPM